MKVMLAKGTWYTVGKKQHAPGEVVEVSEYDGQHLINLGSATLVPETPAQKEEA